MSAKTWNNPRAESLDGIPHPPVGKAGVLCFDDNGFYSFSSLLVLEHIMKRIGNGTETRPCEHFDLICGTGLGGLIALFLGRLGMTIGECLDWFRKNLPSLLPSGQASMFLGWGKRLRTNNRALERAVKAAVRARGLPEDEPLLDPGFSSDSSRRPASCRVFVLAMHPGNIHVPIRLRSYTSKMDPVAADCCLWEAAVAAEASPTYYTPVMMGHPPVPYMAASLGFCNPSKEALDEAARIWALRGGRCLVSLGTGKLPPRLDLDGIPTSSRPFQFTRSMLLIHTMSAIATDTQRVHIELSRDAKFLGLRYFRFEASEGISYKSSYDKSEVLQERVRAAVIRYVQQEEVSKALSFCAEHLHGVLGGSALPPELITQLFPAVNEDELQQRRRNNDRRVKIAILDSGLDAQHKDIIRLSQDDDGKSKIRDVKDWTTSSVGTSDSIGHGTYCAALLLEVAPNADLYVAKVFDSSTADEETPTRVSEAITYAVETWKVDIIAMAFGFQKRHEDILQAVRLAYDRGVIMLAAASNDGALEERPAFPARLDQVICVNSADGLGSSSAFNPQPSIAEDNFTILGEKVESAKVGSHRVRKSGTSVATMIAAGVAALVLELSFQRPASMRESDIRSYSGMRAVFAAMSRDTSTFSTDGRYFIRPWKLLDTEKDLDYILMDIAYILNRL
ncbi:lipid acyl hydrolase [Grosmannia clavigera kw1407]|uniref:Lipid acyl hydrolase n=1 Tax=Grosmannia clavigera (strain kw1407 / UAMH 11150) TaxID=655863 RepID=F0XU80_GROCL|nr:lipid acyl hydrolase [Grosmannia clavigera kw1407]EFW99001.1 lipid acyl hydrolase [Grosmannia clavigera kw1407]